MPLPPTPALGYQDSRILWVLLSSTAAMPHPTVAVHLSLSLSLPVPKSYIPPLLTLSGMGFAA